MRALRGLLPTLTKLGVFGTVCLLCTALVANTLHRPFGTPTAGFSAVFTDALGVKPGSDVRIAGVRVGKVDAVKLREGKALVSFEVTTDQELPIGTGAAVRYADLLGARYVALNPGPARGERLAEGATIPLERTTPALDLTKLFNGFKPIFDVLAPADVNQLAKEIIAVFQGEGPTINALLTRIVSLTDTFAGQDEVIGRVLADLQPVLESTIAHGQDFKDLIAGLGALAGGLADNRGLITEALDSGARLAGTVADVVRQTQPAIDRDLRSLFELSGKLDANREPLVGALHDLPKVLGKVDTILGYGGWVNIYFCNLGIGIGGPRIDIGNGPHSAVCR
ncbi:MCE family protein [Amycolatopsis umgeniensis]|uniref:Phospholipid/cholesterol/gamma-HCH transport system substrate-binding protein n=1 Tax=Amycolatopsis umgeniensis TaxID=336628 RepID=A0A841B0E3_9PSEU|nr:MCE family protein [Amycolatopsis umgeniensis]MBB5852092.1 phospholipid/cholesterol/gamma-HCH transport system substrate-binding protein [Amycolatopsis umgeniensis]